jgi:hypothetical protein
LSDGCKQQFTSNLHRGLNAPFANGFQNGVHLPCTPSVEQWIRKWWTILVQMSCVVVCRNWWSNHTLYDH